MKTLPASALLICLATQGFAHGSAFPHLHSSEAATGMAEIAGIAALIVLLASASLVRKRRTRSLAASTNTVRPTLK